MFREMRRSAQQLPHEQAQSILAQASHGVLALTGDDGYPYAIPISYVYANSKIYFHSAVEGHKIDAIARSGKASFCVVDKDDVLPEKFTTVFRSVICFGKVRILADANEKRAAIEVLADKYSPGLKQAANEMINRTFDRFCIIEFEIEHITGKQAKELC